jgi:hypothetical protein
LPRLTFTSLSIYLQSTHSRRLPAARRSAIKGSPLFLNPFVNGAHGGEKRRFSRSLARVPRSSSFKIYYILCAAPRQAGLSRTPFAIVGGKVGPIMAELMRLITQCESSRCEIEEIRRCGFFTSCLRQSVKEPPAHHFKALR